MKSNKETDKASFLKAKALSDIFATQEGRQPRLLLSKLEQKNDDHNIKFIASAYADIGFDVDLSPLFQSAKDLSKQAIENDVHVIHISYLTHDFIHKISEIIDSLSNYGCNDILVIVDGENVSEIDCKTLEDYGVAIILKSDALISDAAIQILNFLIE
ncbi:hypothetical protein [Formosa sp. PL04]|uniref:hypothetical protein n=1 Tax=Formosa sp. PL04 TaxID=3081755 RepID=UPI0029823118|nr:hypothetical protein [Formosa sp. PL04]MDW5289721.1 hypothetical protein [Formosa sp. PL04]